MNEIIKGRILEFCNFHRLSVIVILAFYLRCRWTNFFLGKYIVRCTIFFELISYDYIRSFIMFDLDSVFMSRFLAIFFFLVSDLGKWMFPGNCNNVQLRVFWISIIIWYLGSRNCASSALKFQIRLKGIEKEGYSYFFIAKNIHTHFYFPMNLFFFLFF